MPQNFFYKVIPFHFVSFSKTPWGGDHISAIKKKYFPNEKENIPFLIGESWEISTDPLFPSQIKKENGHIVNLNEIVQLPLLLKWIHSRDLLSVQLHPENNNPLLKENECGKSEAWLVVDVEPSGFVYLGFKEGLSQDQIMEYLRNNEAEKCLYKFTPKKFDYISVPPGCVHALGPGVFVAEPQNILPNKSGKTWRISDWKRLYNGKPRELHVEQALDAIDWNLPRGAALEKMLVREMKSGVPFYGDETNPFALELFSEMGVFPYAQLQKNSFSVVTVFSGQVTISVDADADKSKSITLIGGESAFIPAETTNMHVHLEHYLEDPVVAFFGVSQ